MAFDTLQKSRMIMDILSCVGIFTNKKLCDKLPNFPPIYHKLLLHVPLTFTFTLLMWLQVPLSSDLNQATDVLYITLTETGLVVKILTVWYNEPLVKSMFKEWQQNEMFKLQTTQECVVWQRCINIFSIFVFVFVGCSLAMVVSACAAVLFLDSYQLPFLVWLPFNWEHPSYYWYAYCYEIIAMPLTCIANSTLDMFFCYLMQHLALHFKVMALRLEILGTKMDETNADITRKLLAIIKLYLKLKRMSKECQSIVKYPIFTQISLSALILCFSLYRLQNMNVLADPMNFLSIVLYAVVMNLQIFLFCFYGNKLTLESAALIKSLYNCNWMEMSMQNRKLVLQFMQPLQEPVVIKAGNFFNVDLLTYTKTLNNAYSFFALLLNMDIE